MKDQMKQFCLLTCARKTCVNFPPSPPLSALVEKWRPVNRKRFVFPVSKDKICYYCATCASVDTSVDTQNVRIWSLENPHERVRYYKSLIRSVLTYTSETWLLTLRDEEALGIFERKILRCILGGIQVNGSRRRRSSLELYKICKQLDIVKFVRLRRLKRAGYLAGMNKDRCCKKIFLAKSMGNRPRGRPPLRGIDYFEKDVKLLKVKNWKKSCEK
ncbi:putative endonuclease-reverse transcriptase [Trichonephila clavipes]|nr:putative endonuclease-reverse transcriptase [Trichonephila clavipes]